MGHPWMQPVLATFDPVAQGATVGLLLARQAEAVLPSTVAGLTNVTLAVSTSQDPLQSTINSTILYYDNFQYTTREVCCN